jgi:hypothetical protein
LLGSKFALELVSVVILCSALVFFELFGAGAPTARRAPGRLFKPGLLITIMALLVVGQGIFHTGALDGPTRSAVHVRCAPKLTIVTLFALVFGVSAFINNTPVVVMFIPILGAMAARMGGSPSAFMMPLSFVCIFAGMTTLIGSSTNLLVADSLREPRVRRWAFSNRPEWAPCSRSSADLYRLCHAALLPERGRIRRRQGGVAGQAIYRPDRSHRGSSAGRRQARWPACSLIWATSPCG